MNEYEIKEMEELTDDAKTIAEHSRLILTYRQTGFLNREEAIRKYKEFNTKHQEYCAGVEVSRIIGAHVIPLEQMSDHDIAANLNCQLMYIGGKNLLEGLNHA